MNDFGVFRRWRSGAPYLLSVLRVVVALVFIEPGSAKLFAFPVAIMPGGGTAAAFSLPWIAGVLEVFGGALLLVGLFTRPVAFLLSGEMAVAYFKGHAPHGFWPIVNHGELAIIFCVLWLYFSAAGPGALSLDAVRHRDAGRSH
jgi:putative oxidoreductase